MEFYYLLDEKQYLKGFHQSFLKEKTTNCNREIIKVRVDQSIELFQRCNPAAEITFVLGSHSMLKQKRSQPLPLTIRLP